MAQKKEAAKGDGYIEKLVRVNRTATVVKGGRVFGFDAAVVVGDGDGKVGFGRGKSKEVPAAIPKSDGTRTSKYEIHSAGQWYLAT